MTITTTVGDNIVKRRMHESRAYPALPPKEMERFILFVQERPFLPANMTYRDWYEKEKNDTKKNNTLIRFMEEFK